MPKLSRILPSRDETEFFVSRNGWIVIVQRPLDRDEQAVGFPPQDIPLVIEHLRALVAELAKDQSSVEE